LELYKEASKMNKITIPYSLSRGCINECKFCIFRNIDGSWQSKSVKKALQDIAFLKEKYRTDVFSLTDTNFNLSYKHVEDFCDGLINSKVNIRWDTLGQLQNLDERLLAKIKKSGCVMIKWGVESGSNRILQAMSKKGKYTVKVNF